MRKRSLLFVVIAFGLAACGGDESAVLGTWKFNFEASARALQPDLERVARGPARKKLRDDALDFLERKMAGLEITLELAEGGEAVFVQKGRGAEKRYVGEWRYDGKQNEVVISAKGTTERYRLDGDTLRFQIPVTETDGAGSRTVELILERA